MDGISSTKVSNWDTAYSQRHSHSNKTVLDSITQTDIDNWNENSSSSGETGHTHSNLSTLNSITSTKVSNWDTAYTRSHTHSNLDVLNRIGGSGDIMMIDADILTMTSCTSSCLNLIVSTSVSDTNANGIIITGAATNEVKAKESAVIAGQTNKVTANDSAVLAGVSNAVNAIRGVAIGGFGNEVSGSYGTAFGSNNNALSDQFKLGHNATDGTAGTLTGTSGDAFIIGNGTIGSPHNAFRVAYSGAVYGQSAFNSTGADYAEYFEWEDGNTDNVDRRGLMVTWGNNNTIKLANTEDEIIGVVSSNPSLIGNAYEDNWQGMYETDVFNKPISHMVHHDAEYEEIEVPDEDENGNILETTHTEQILIHEAYDAEEYVLNSNYDSEQEYIPRSQRKEWAIIGLLGQIVVIDDSTCKVGGYCKCGNNGTATASDSGYRVLERLDDTHIRIFFK